MYLFTDIDISILPYKIFKFVSQFDFDQVQKYSLQNSIQYKFVPHTSGRKVNNLQPERLHS